MATKERKGDVRDGQKTKMASKEVRDKERKGDARDILECSICMEPFKNPKGLPCIHTFCLECLEKYGEDERPGDEMPCPICRRIFQIPPGGFNELPNNIFIEQIVESTKLSKVDSPNSGVMCEG